MIKCVKVPGVVLTLLLTVLLISPRLTSAAPEDYTQTALGYQTFLPVNGLHFLSAIPDPDTNGRDDLFLYQAFPFFSDGIDIDVPIFPTNTVRRNPVVNTWSNTLTELLSFTSDFEPEGFAFSLWGGPGYVGVLGVGGESGFDAPVLGLVPLASEVGGSGPFLSPVGTGFIIPLLNSETLPAISLEDLNLPNFEFGITNPFITYQYYDSKPFPGTDDNPGILLSGTIQPEDSNGSPDGNEQVVVFGANVDAAGSGLSLLPVKIVHELDGPRRDSNTSGASTRPLLADFNGDSCVDLAVLIDVDDSDADDFLVTLRGDCSGNFDSVAPVAHNLGPNFAVVGLAAVDLNNDGMPALFINYAAPGNTGSFPDIPDGRVDVVLDPLGDFAVSPGPTLPSGMRPTFAHGTDCDQDGINDDFLSTGIEFFDIPFTDSDEIPGLKLSDVVCFLDGGDETTTVYPKEKLNFNVAAAGGDFLPTLMKGSTIGQMGCGPGWTGSVFYPIPIDGGDGDGNGDTTRTVRFGASGSGDGDGDGDGDGGPAFGINHIFIGEHSDCDDTPINPIGPGGDLSGSGCRLGSSPVNSASAGWFLIGMIGLALMGRSLLLRRDD